MTIVSIEDQIRTLSAASLEDLRGRWQKRYGCLPSKHISRKLLIRALAYEAQVKVSGGLKASTKRKLIAIAKGETPGPQKKVFQAGQPVPGSRLLREWHGKTYIVEVTQSSFLWEGEDYASLSAVAMAITGAKWNGRRFFGLTKAKSKSDNSELEAAQ
jgi:hypothetical protein